VLLLLVLLLLPCSVQPLRIFPVGQGMTPLAAAFSPDGKQLAMGMDGGGLKGFEFHPDMRQVGTCTSNSCKVYGLQGDGW
jgi:hypothetical protein